MSEKISFWINDELVEIDNQPITTTLLRFLRDELKLTGTKEGCAEGDCGACTVALLKEQDGKYVWRAVDSCLILLPMLHKQRIYTIESLASQETLHPVQEAVVNYRASQCGYCTPGVVMSMFEACYRSNMDNIEEQMAGNLCRCTGYRPIREATKSIAGLLPDDRFKTMLSETPVKLRSLRYKYGNYSFHQPITFTELWNSIKELESPRFIAGGTDLGLESNKGKRSNLISLTGIDELRKISTGDVIRVGALTDLTTLMEFMEGPDGIPAIVKALRFFGSRQIRNLATIGGSLCNASPIGDMAPILLALDARVVAISEHGERIIPLSEFFVSYRKVALKKGEILGYVEIPPLSRDAWLSFYKVSKRREMDISAVSAGMSVELQQGVVTKCRIAYGGVAATPIRAFNAENVLTGKAFSEESISLAEKALTQDLTPISDVRGSSDYRLILAKNLLLGFMLESGRKDRDSLLPHPTATVNPGVIDD